MSSTNVNDIDRKVISTMVKLILQRGYIEAVFTVDEVNEGAQELDPDLNNAQIRKSIEGTLLPRGLAKDQPEGGAPPMYNLSLAPSAFLELFSDQINLDFQQIKKKVISALEPNLTEVEIGEKTGEEPSVVGIFLQSFQAENLIGLVRSGQPNARWRIYDILPEGRRYFETYLKRFSG